MDGPRLTIQTQAVLGALLAADGEVYGLQIVRASGLAAGTIYPILQRLRTAGWIVARWEPDEQAHTEHRPPRRYYDLTPQGRARAVNALNAARTRHGNLSRLLDLADPGSAAPVE
jgi:DNA-binding PadR family transcriptional regulator